MENTQKEELEFQKRRIALEKAIELARITGCTGINTLLDDVKQIEKYLFNKN